MTAGRIEPVAIEREEDLRSGRHGLENRGDAVLVHLPGRHQDGAPRPGVREVAGPRRADAALPDLHDTLDMRHLGGAPHGRGEASTLPCHFLAPVDVGIDLDDGERPPALESLEDGDGNRIVAADDDRDRAPCYDSCNGLTNRDAVRSRIGLGAGEVAGIDHRDRAWEDRPAEVEVDVVDVACIAGDCIADRPRRPGAVRPD